MRTRIMLISLFILGGCLILYPRNAHAVIPPDFVFSIGTQIAQFFSMIMLFFATIFGASFQFFKTRYYAILYRSTVLTFGVLGLTAVALGSSYLYARHRQRIEYQAWLEESKRYGGAQPDITSDSLGGGAGFRTDEPEDYDDRAPSESDGAGKIVSAVDENDLLVIGGEESRVLDVSVERFISSADTHDAPARFINEYYRNIAYRNFARAYEMSKQTVDYDTFRNWYRATTKVVLDKLVRIDETTSSIELTLLEGGTFIRYGVLMTLDVQNGVPVRVERSEVKVLAQGTTNGGSPSRNERALAGEYYFYDLHKERNIFITNQEFQASLGNGAADAVVLDAREDIEFENGYFPGSVHIRFADLKAGRWIELPNDKIVFVICWSGIRGKEVAQFLRTKRIVAMYLEHGAEGWVESGGKWIGSIKFSETYNDPRYRKVFDTDEVKRRVQEGAVLVDTREPVTFDRGHIAGSMSIPVMYIPTIRLEETLGQVPPRSNVITVCDTYVNCFDAKITGIELERRGHRFLGRYPKPWEYGK